jgi:dTDP-4-dehydrorhamnose 3,5-epimerase-like enzyme
MNLDQVRFIDIPSQEDNRGILSSVEQFKDIPIEIKRIFYIHKVQKNRGGHANIDTDQILIPVIGSLSIKLYDKDNSKVFLLDNPTKGLFIPRMIYLEMFDFSENSVLLVLANTEFDITKYLRTKEEYYSYVNGLK